MYPVSNSKKKIIAKFMPQCDDPYLIVSQRLTTSYTIDAIMKLAAFTEKCHVRTFSSYVAK